MTHTEPENLISLKKAAVRINVSVRSLYRLIADHELPPPVKVGRLSKMCESEVDDYITKVKARRPNLQNND